MEKAKHNRLQELDRSSYEIVKGEPDIRGWDVRYMTGQKLGTVEELILDTVAKKVRYMVVDLDENDLKLAKRKLMIPIGMAELDRKEDDVLIPNITVEQLSRLPGYDRNNLTAGVERRIAATLGREIEHAEMVAAEQEHPHPASERPKSKAEKQVIREERHTKVKDDDEIEADFYTHEQYNLDNLYKNRLHEAESKRKNESEFERGLRLWERRSDGGIIDDTYRDIDEDARLEKIRNRRSEYRKRRFDESV